LRAFDFVVANPPFSTKAWSNGFNPAEDLYGRFEDGIPPQKNGDYAFLLHFLRSMKSTGKGAIIMPHGVLFRGGAEGEIRKNILRKGYIKGIIGLPPNLFYGTSIPACIIVLDKENAAGRKGIFMVNASKGFMKDGNKNRLRHQDIHKIVDVFNRQLEIPKYSRMVPLSEISDLKNDYNLNIPRYIDNTEEEDLQDIEAHLLGSIPNRDLDALGNYWKVFPRLREQLFAPADRPGYSQIKVAGAQVKPTIFAHPKFIAYNRTITTLFEKWKQAERPRLTGLEVGSHPRALIDLLGEDLLATFAEAPLLDRYDVYQDLMTYWTGTMQDDVYMIATEGWEANLDLIPAALLIQRYFSAEQKAIETLTAEQEAINAQMEELNEEQGGEDGQLSAVMSDKGKVSKGNLKARISELTPNDIDEVDLLRHYLQMIDQAAEAGRKVKEAQEALDEKVAFKYAKLTLEEIKSIVIDDKWLATIASNVDAQAQAIASQFATRLKELAERYTATLPALTDNVETLTAKVDAHLQKMGFAWK
jgi:type I restriction enzyme M protein